MAIWQYTFYIIPKESLISGIFIPQYDEDGLFEDDIYWEKVRADTSIFDSVEKIAPKNKSWSENILLFGDEDSNCFEIYHKSNYVESVTFRVDFFSDYELFLGHILDFIRFNDLILLNEQNQITEPDYLSIKNLMENSHQAKLYHKLSSKE
ncbi:MAG: hypothetical protein AAF518_22625 [Spirochaetota bacterium]